MAGILGTKSKMFLEAEKLLHKLGYRPGRVDGVFDRNTLAASRRFENQNPGTGKNGRIDAKQLGLMRKQAKAFISPAQLRAVMPRLPLAKAKLYAPMLTRAMAEGNITTRRRKAAFLSQLAHESGQLKYMEEIASGAAYEGRRDLGNYYRGDGRRYKGRGPIQLTGRANYRAAGKALGLPLERNPTLAASPKIGFRIAAWYWTKRNINSAADRGDITRVSKLVNGGYNGLSSRIQYYRKALSVLV